MRLAFYFCLKCVAVGVVEGPVHRYKDISASGG